MDSPDHDDEFSESHPNTLVHRDYELLFKCQSDQICYAADDKQCKETKENELCENKQCDTEHILDDEDELNDECKEDFRSPVLGLKAADVVLDHSDVSTGYPQCMCQYNLLFEMFRKYIQMCNIF